MIVFIYIGIIFILNDFTASSFAADSSSFSDSIKAPSSRYLSASSVDMRLIGERKEMEGRASSMDIEKQGTANCWKRVYGLFKTIYERSPVNLSRITGLSHLELPRLKGHVFLGRYAHINQHGLLANLMEAAELANAHSSGACYFWIGAANVLLVTKPTHIKQILVYNDASISRNTGIGDNVSRVFGKSIFFDEGELWRQKRQLWKQWLFTNEALRLYAPCMQRSIRQYLDRLNDSSGRGVDLQKFFTEFTLDIIGRTLMANDNLAEVAEQLASLMTIGLKAATSPSAAVQDKREKLFKMLSLGKEPVGFNRLSQIIHKFFVDRILTPNEEKLKMTHCLLRAIHEIAESDEINRSKSRVADSIFLVFAGHNTTAATFQFAVKLLAAHPVVTRKLREELYRNLTSDALTIEAVERVDYLDWIIKETLRLFPPVSIFSRGIIRSFCLTNIPTQGTRDEYQASLRRDINPSIYLARGTSVVISPYILHRSETLFRDASQFIPERFSPERIREIPAYGYIPFGTGPHACLGQRLALQELKLMLAAIYYHFDIEIENNDMSLNPFDVALTPYIKPIARFRPNK